MPLSDRHHECEELVFGADGEGLGGTDIVVELIMRSSGGSGRKRGVERMLEGWVSSSATPCDLRDLESLKTLWTKTTVVLDVCHTFN